MNEDVAPSGHEEPKPELLVEMNAEMLERVRDVAQQIKERVRKVTEPDSPPDVSPP